MERGSGRLFVNEGAFAEHFMVAPQAREGQILRLRQAVAPMFRGLKPLHVLLVGPSGSGKTLVARHVLAEIAKKGLPVSYVNCMEHGSLYAVLDKIVLDHRILNADRVSTVYKTEQITRFLKDRPFVLVLDEVDRILPKDRSQILYALTNFGKIGIVCIASNASFLQSLDEHVRSRLMPTVIQFKPYELNDIKAIVQQRAEIGLAKNACREETAKEVALLAQGNARTAVQALRRAAVNAGQHDGASITSGDIRTGWQTGAELKHEHALGLLNDHKRAIFRILQSLGEMTTNRLRQEYVLECERLGLRPIAQRTFWCYLTELEAAGLVEGRSGLGRNSYRIHRVAGFGEPARDDK